MRLTPGVFFIHKYKFCKDESVGKCQSSNVMFTINSFPPITKISYIDIN